MGDIRSEPNLHPSPRIRPTVSIPNQIWNPGHIQALKAWLETLLGETIPAHDVLLSGTPFADGQLLFRIVRELAPDFRPGVRMVETHLPFLAGNNVDFFLSFLRAIHVPKVRPSLATAHAVLSVRFHGRHHERAPREDVCGSRRDQVCALHAEI